MGLWNIPAKFHAWPKNAAFAYFGAHSLCIAVKITVKNGSYFYLLESYFFSVNLLTLTLTLEMT